MSERERTATTHTGGPWIVEEDEPGCYQVLGPTQEDGLSGGYRWFLRPDAILIAAAPDLLALVKAIRADASAYPWHIAAAAAIAKAEGR